MMTLNFSPFPVLETDRLVLRRLDANDANEVFALRSNPETMKYVPRPLAKTIDDALAHIEIIDKNINENLGINWAITLKGNPKFIGIIGHFRIDKENFRSEIGYMLLPEFHKQGIIPEAISKIIDYGFDVLNLHSLEAIIDPENYGSERVLQKCGFIKEAHFIENEYYEGTFLDTVIYSLLKRNRK